MYSASQSVDYDDSSIPFSIPMGTEVPQNSKTIKNGKVIPPMTLKQKPMLNKISDTHFEVGPFTVSMFNPNVSIAWELTGPQIEPVMSDHRDTLLRIAAYLGQNADDDSLCNPQMSSLLQDRHYISR
jgi:hypothetical protein